MRCLPIEEPARTNIEIDDALLAEAMAATGLRTKRKVVEAGLRLLARHKRQANARACARGRAPFSAHCSRVAELERGDREAAADLLAGDLVLCEVLRGSPEPRPHAAVKDVLLSFEVVTIGGVELALEAADHYRALRRLGITVRQTIDLLIDTYCIAAGCALLHSARDFDPMTRHLGLRTL